MQSSFQVVIVGAGYVADFYMRTKQQHANVVVLGAFDIRSERLKVFCDYWDIPAFDSLEALLSALPENGLVLNLTNPAAHYEVSRACLEAGRHVYSEKPLATEFEQASELVELARKKSLFLGGAPCSYLSETAQTLGAAVRAEMCGPVRLVYAELDDGYIPQAPHESWLSESGAPWPYEDEIHTGCTLEHAGYVLTWLIAIFGRIKTITAFSAVTIDKGLDVPCSTPDTSIGILHFAAGPVVRLTCSIVAPHDHRMRMIGDAGLLDVHETWDNHARVTYRKRVRIRRRLLEMPLGRRVKLAGKSPHKKTRGAPGMDYFLGPVELLKAINGEPVNRASAELALHTTEATLFLQNAGTDSTTYHMQSMCDPIPPYDWARV